MTRLHTFLLLTIGIGLFSEAVAIADERQALPDRAVRVLGNDDYVFPATDVRFLDQSRVLAMGRHNAAIIDVESGKVFDLASLVKNGHYIGRPVLGGTRWLATAIDDRTQTKISIWDLEQPKTHREITRKGPLPKFAVSRDGRRLVVFNSTTMSLDFFDVAGHVVDRQPVSNEGPVTELLFARGGDVLMVKHKLPDGNESRYTFYEFSSDGLLGDELSSFADDRKYYRVIAPRSDDHVIFTSYDCTVTVHNFVTNETTATIKLDVSAMSADMDSTGTKLVTSGASVWMQIWDLAPGHPTPISKIDVGDRPGGLAFSPDDKMIVTSSAGRVRFWDVETGEQLHQREEQVTGPLRAVAIAPDESRIAAADYQGRVQMWDLDTGQLTRLRDKTFRGRSYDPWPSPQFLAFSPDGTRLLGGSNKAHNVVNLWNAETGQKIEQIAGHQWPIMGVAWSPDGGMFASTSRDSTLRVTDLEADVVHVFKSASMSPAFFPDGERIVTASKHGDSSGLHVFSLRTGKLEKLLKNTESYGMAWGLAVSPDGKQVAASIEGGRIQMWNVGSGNVVFDELLVETSSSGRKAGAVAFSPDGQTLAATTGSKSIWLLDAQTGELRSKLTGHRGPVTGLAFSNKHLVSASSDFRVIIWEMPTRD